MGALCTVMDEHPNLGIFRPHPQWLWNRLWVYYDPDLYDTVTEDALINIFMTMIISSSIYAPHHPRQPVFI